MEHENTEMKRGLKNRHLQMIALGGAIGTGLFYGSTSTIALAGPSAEPAITLGAVSLALGVGVQNLPEGAAIALPLRGEGSS